jgi:hypothetical protein
VADIPTRAVPLSRARRWTWLLIAVAFGFAAWHVYGIAVAPERPFFWIGVAFDVLVGVVGWLLGRAWPPVARFGAEDAEDIALDQTRIPYAAITEVRRGAVSAKPFWLAFWLPTSLLGGLIVALRPTRRPLHRVLHRLRHRRRGAGPARRPHRAGRGPGSALRWGGAARRERGLGAWPPPAAT